MDLDLCHLAFARNRSSCQCDFGSLSFVQGGTASPTCPDLQSQSNLLEREMETARRMQDICSPASGASQTGFLSGLQQQSNSIPSRDAAAQPALSPHASAQQPSGQLDGAISRPGQSSISELPISSKPPRPPVPTARLGQFDTSTPFGRSPPTTSPPMLAPKMKAPGGSAPFDRRSRLQNNQPPDQFNPCQLGGQLRTAEDHDKSMTMQQNYRTRIQDPNQNHGPGGSDHLSPSLFMMCQQEQVPRTEIPISQLGQSHNHTQPIVLVPIEDAARRNEEDESKLYIGPINPFFVGRSSPARGENHSFGALRGLSGPGQMSPSASAFYQAGRAIATAVDDSRPGTVRSSHNDSRRFVSTGGNQVVQKQLN